MADSSEKPNSRRRKSSGASDKKSANHAAPALVTPGVADAVASLLAYVNAELTAGIANVGSDFQMRLSRFEDCLVDELNKAGLPPIVPRRSRKDGTEFTSTDLPYRQGEGMQSYRWQIAPDQIWRDRLAALSVASPHLGQEPAAEPASPDQMTKKTEFPRVPGKRRKAPDTGKH